MYNHLTSETSGNLKKHHLPEKTSILWDVQMADRYIFFHHHPNQLDDGSQEKNDFLRMGTFIVGRNIEQRDFSVQAGFQILQNDKRYTAF